MAALDNIIVFYDGAIVVAHLCMYYPRGTIYLCNVNKWYDETGIELVM